MKITGFNSQLDISLRNYIELNIQSETKVHDCMN